MSIARPPVSDRVSRPAEDDLPDIIDIVMEMGRADSDLPKQPPSPPLQPASGLPAHLEKLADRARDYVEAASSANTRRAYAADWKHFCAWARRQHLEVLPPDPQVVGLYITACASGKATGDRKPNAVATIERRLSSLTWNYTQRGQPLDRKDRHIATVLAGIRNSHAKPPVQKEAILPEDLIAMLETLDRGTLRGLRDRAMLLLGFAGGLRRSEIVGLDVARDHTEDGRGWVEFFPDKGVLVTLRGKTGWREVEIGRGSSDATCPVVALGNLAETRPYRPWPAVPARHRARQGGRLGAAERPGGGTAGQTRRPCRRRPRRPCQKANGRRSSRAIRCAPAWPPRPRSTSAMCKNNSATPRPR